MRRGALLAVLVAILISCTALRDRPDFWNARRDSSHQAPDPAEVPEAVIQVYGARTLGWRGILGVHTWIVTKADSGARLHALRSHGMGREPWCSRGAHQPHGSRQLLVRPAPREARGPAGRRRRRAHREGRGSGGLVSVSIVVSDVARTQQQYLHRLRGTDGTRAAPRSSPDGHRQRLPARRSARVAIDTGRPASSSPSSGWAVSSSASRKGSRSTCSD